MFLYLEIGGDGKKYFPLFFQRILGFKQLRVERELMQHLIHVFAVGGGITRINREVLLLQFQQS